MIIGGAKSLTRSGHALGLTEQYAKEASTFASASAEDLSALIFCQRLSHLMSPDPSQKKVPGAKGEAFISKKSLETLWTCFRNWPEGFLGQMSLHRGQRRSLGSTYLLAKPLNCPDALPAVRTALADWDARWRKSPRPYNNRPVGLMPAAVTHVGIKHLMKSAGCTYDVARHWLHSGWLGNYRTVRRANGTLTYQIGVEQVARAVHIARSTSSVKEMARSIGIDIAALRALVAGGVLQPVRHGRGNHNVRLIPNQVFAMARSVLQVALRGQRTSHDPIQLSTALVRLRESDPRLIQPFMEAIHSRKLKVRCYQAEVSPLDDVVIRLEDFERWRCDQRVQLSAA